MQEAGIGDGPVDAALKAIDRLTHTHGKLMDYSVARRFARQGCAGRSHGQGGFWQRPNLVTGKGASTDVIEASARAYLNAVNRFLCGGNGKVSRAAP